jgi:hypothetical protein
MRNASCPIRIAQTDSTKATVVADADNRHPKRIRFSRKTLTNSSFVAPERWHRILNAPPQNRVVIQ